MYKKKHSVSISVFSVLATLILGAFAPVFSENGAETPPNFTLQLLHAADMEGDIEALENAPSVLIGTECAQSSSMRNTVIIGAGDSYTPGPLFAAGNDRSLRDVS